VLVLGLYECEIFLLVCLATPPDVLKMLQSSTLRVVSSSELNLFCTLELGESKTEKVLFKINSKNKTILTGNRKTGIFSQN